MYSTSEKFHYIFRWQEIELFPKTGKINWPLKYITYYVQMKKEILQYLSAFDITPKYSFSKSLNSYVYLQRKRCMRWYL